MPRIRDLGINAIPEKRNEDVNGLFACAQNTCQAPSGCPHHTQQQCENCTDTGICQQPTCEDPPLTGAKDKDKDKDKRKTITDEAVSQLQYQLQQKIANQADLTV